MLALVAGLAAMAYAYGSADHQIASRRAQAASLAAQAQQAQSAAERLAPYTSFIALREQRMQAVDTLIDSRFDWAHVFHEFGRVLPSQTSVTSLTGNIGAAASVASAGTPAGSRAASSSAAGTAAVASATPPGSVPTFTLAGCATSQPVVALTLERLRLIDGVKEVTLQSSSSGASGGCTRASPLHAHGHIRSAAELFCRRCRDQDGLGLDQRRLCAGVSRHPRGEREMTTRDRTVLIVVVLVAVLGAAWMLVVAPERQQASQLGAQVLRPRRSLRAPKARRRARAPRSPSTPQPTPPS